ncbi:Retrovirus-related Pol polyprotein from transposon opus [Sesbania bispinosa]|nr:Retrovirus-related Pol polyprotein from transposon opus [Sesbania bispinosa]
MAMKVDSDPFATNASYAEPLEILMVDFEKVGLNGPTDGIIEQFENEVTPIYPKVGETLIDFLAEKKENNQEVMLCPRCSAIFDKSVAKAFEEYEKRKNFQNQNQIRNGSHGKPYFNGKFSRDTPMTKTQWRRYQRIKKAEHNISNQPQQRTDPSNFNLKAICGVVSILPAEFAQQTLGQQEEEDFEDTKFDYGSRPSKVSFVTWAEPKSNSAIFDPPNDFMKNHLKPLFVNGRVNGYFVNRMFVDGVVAINLIPKSSLKKLGKIEEDLLPHNIVITNFNGKTSKCEGMIELDIEVAPLRIENPSSKEEGMYPIM